MWCLSSQVHCIQANKYKNQCNNYHQFHCNLNMLHYPQPSYKTQSWLFLHSSTTTGAQCLDFKQKMTPSWLYLSQVPQYSSDLFLHCGKMLLILWTRFLPTNTEMFVCFHHFWQMQCMYCQEPFLAYPGSLFLGIRQVGM